MSSPAGAADEQPERGGAEGAQSQGKRLREDGDLVRGSACSEDQHSSPAADTGIKAQDTAATATTAQQQAVAPPPTPVNAEEDKVAEAEDAATAAEDGTDGARKRKKRTNSTFEESADGWWKPLKWLMQCDPVKLHRHTLEWIELVRRCGHAQKRSGHNLNAYAGSKPISLQLTVLDLQLPPPPPRLSPRKSASREDRSGLAVAQSDGRESATAEPATHTEIAATFDSSKPNAAVDAVAADTVATDGAMASPETNACSSPAEKLSPNDHDEDEDNVARVPTPHHMNAK